MKKPSLFIGVSLVIFGIILGTRTLVSAIYYAPEKEVTFAKSPFFLETPGTPVRIRIPKIDVDTAIEPVGITYLGNMSTPKILSNTGWYKYGTTPGAEGSAVIDGHVDDGLGLPGVFKNLKELRVNDDVYIETKDKTMLHFKVIDVQTYFYTKVPREIVFNRKGDSYLNLITCDGDWIQSEKTSDRRVVVYTKLVQ